MNDIREQATHFLTREGQHAYRLDGRLPLAEAAAELCRNLGLDGEESSRFLFKLNLQQHHIFLTQSPDEGLYAFAPGPEHHFLLGRVWDFWQARPLQKAAASFKTKMILAQAVDYGSIVLLPLFCLLMEEPWSAAACFGTAACLHFYFLYRNSQSLGLFSSGLKIVLKGRDYGPPVGRLIFLRFILPLAAASVSVHLNREWSSDTEIVPVRNFPRA